MSDEKMIEGVLDHQQWLRGAFLNQLEKKKINAVIGEDFRSLMLMQERFQGLKSSDGKIVFVFIDDQTEIGRESFQRHSIGGVQQCME